ncbi:hypothetical protein CBM2592_B130056 [Cupriavidus taiwanensis]|nr:hypothetical protein CBM2592_B130056 [Cupriavidus taiwanensis]SOY94295.1 hypothetical protein CBM2591_B120056 [Cupriavidus taiwanensis]SOZ27897.1 hypothetical protein CBM2608_B130055 [Cupriavidus taiwanensis]SOZ70439.1 hypothetical protein CBM2617_B160054 [Cupriavidus taiwanensis]SOZ86185.1 hypothetical protein CBM2618_B170057 [Cupriavidus taiwanensis]
MQVGRHGACGIALAARRGKAPLQVGRQHVAADADEQRLLGRRDLVQAPARAAHALRDHADGQRRDAFAAQQARQVLDKVFVGASRGHQAGGVCIRLPPVGSNKGWERYVTTISRTHCGMTPGARWRGACTAAAAPCHAQREGPPGAGGNGKSGRAM